MIHKVPIARKYGTMPPIAYALRCILGGIITPVDFTALVDELRNTLRDEQNQILTNGEEI